MRQKINFRKSHRSAAALLRVPKNREMYSWPPFQLTVIDSVTVFSDYWFIFAKYAPRAIKKATDEKRQVWNSKKKRETKFGNSRELELYSGLSGKESKRTWLLSWIWRWQLTCVPLSAVAPARVKKSSLIVSSCLPFCGLVSARHFTLHFHFAGNKLNTVTSYSYKQAEGARTSWADSWDETGVIRPVQLKVIES